MKKIAIITLLIGLSLFFFSNVQKNDTVIETNVSMVNGPNDIPTQVIPPVITH